jgi:restriction system protein
MKSIIAAIVIVLLASPALLADQFYRWVDKDGTVHITNNPESIPDKFRETAQSWTSESNEATKLRLVKNKIVPNAKKLFENLSSELKEIKNNKQALAVLVIALASIIVLPLGYFKLRKHREEEISLRAVELVDIQNMDNERLKQFLRKLLQHQGFRVESCNSHDDSTMDIVARKDGTKYAVQVKREISDISKEAIVNVIAEKNRHNCGAAIVITNSYFTNGAIQSARSEGCELVDRDALAKWISNFKKGGVGSQ